MTVDEEKLMGYVHQAVGDFGSILTGALINIGDKLGLFKAMVAAGPLTPAELAEKTGTTERYVREWASGLAAAGYVDYAGDGRYQLNEEQAIALADETSPAYVMGGFQGMMAATRIVPKAVEAFRTGDGIGWHEHDPDLFQGTERFLSARLRRQPGPVLDPGPRWRRRQTSCWRQGRRCRMRVRCVDDHHGRGLPELAVLGF